MDGVRKIGRLTAHGGAGQGIRRTVGRRPSPAACRELVGLGCCLGFLVLQYQEIGCFARLLEGRCKCRASGQHLLVPLSWTAGLVVSCNLLDG